MYTRFSGENGQSAARWLRTLKYELPPTFTAGRWLECVDGLLDGQAARWADEQPAVKKILSDESLEDAKNHVVDIFKALLLSRFTPGESDLAGVTHLVENLRQDATESLNDYYLRAVDLLEALGVKDGIDTVMMNIYEKSMSRKVTRHFIDGLYQSYRRPGSAPSLVEAWLNTSQENAS